MKIIFNRAGLKIRGHVFGNTAHPQDTVILSHGFMANERMCFKYAKLLAKMGYLTVTFYFCGGGIISRSDGCSQGGFVSGLVAAELGAEVIDRLIMFYPAVCIPDDARKGKMMFYRFDPENIPSVIARFPMKLGGDYARTVINMDPYGALNGYFGPVLLIHGTADKIVNISYARKLKRIYQNCRYEEIEGGGHMFKGKADEQACHVLQNFMETRMT